MSKPSNATRLTDVLSFRLNVLSRAIDSKAEHNSMRHINMTLLETRITHYLYENGAKPIVAIARDMCVDVGQISRMVVSLVDKGHAERAPNPADGRSTIISLTRSGRDSVAKRIRSVLRWNEILADQLSDEEFRMLCAALDKLTDFVRAPADNADVLPGPRKTAAPNAEASPAKKPRRKARALAAR